jgi:hypothetical protein
MGDDDTSLPDYNSRFRLVAVSVSCLIVEVVFFNRRSKCSLFTDNVSCPLKADGFVILCG